MASTTLTKDTGVLRLLLLGLLLPAVLVSGESTTMPPTTMTSGASTPATTMSTISVGIETTSSQPPSTASTSQSTSSASATTTQPSSSTIPGSTTMSSTVTTQPPTSATVMTTAASQPLTSSGATTSSATNQSPVTTASSTATATQPITSATTGVGSTGITQSNPSMTASGGTSSSSSMTSGAGSWTSMMSTTQSSNSSGGMPSINMTANPASVNCPSFVCNYSDCYTMYTNQNASSCVRGYCQLLRQADMSYAASCSSFCANSCDNKFQTNCTVECCNSTGCLNASFESMMMTTTTVIATTTTTATTTATTTTTTTTTSPANNGKKCHRGACNGTSCYKAFKDIQICSSSEPHCELKKKAVGSEFQWTAGCTTNCSGQTSCKADTKSPCHLECCNATTVSCLWLNGTLNVPSFATRGPYIHTELIACLLCLLAFTLML